MILSVWMEEVFSHIKENKFNTIISLLSIGFTITIFSLFLLIYYNIDLFFNKVMNEAKIILYLKDGIQDDDINIIRGNATKLKEISKVTYVSKENAIKELNSLFNNEGKKFEDIEGNPIPASVELQIKKDYSSESDVNRLVDKLGRINGVEDVQYPKKWLHNFNKILITFTYVTLGIGIILCVAVIIIIFNTINQRIYNFRDDVEIMKLMGATKWFINTPFLIEGSLLGLVGSAFSIILLKILSYFFIENIMSDIYLNNYQQMFMFLPLTLIIPILISGLVLGYFGSIISLYRLL